MNTKSRRNLNKVLLSAMFLSISVIAATFVSIDVPLFGVKGVELNPSGIFTTFPAFLFGPFFGGIVAGLTDFISFLLKPQGAYIPLMSVVLFIGGFLKGLIWLGIRKADKKNVRIFVLVLMCIIGFIGVFNHISLFNDKVTNKFISTENSVISKESIYSALEEGKLGYVSKVANKLTIYSSDEKHSVNLAKHINIITIGFELASVLSLGLLAIDYLLDRADKKNGKEKRVSFIKILIAVLIPGLIVTILNTQVLIWFITVLNGRSFLILLIPRIIPSFISHTVQAYFVAILYDVYEKFVKNKIVI